MSVRGFASRLCTRSAVGRSPSEYLREPLQVALSFNFSLLADPRVSRLGAPISRWMLILIEFVHRHFVFYVVRGFGMAS